MATELENLKAYDRKAIEYITGCEEGKKKTH
jgi:hypothetical protein